MASIYESPGQQVELTGFQSTSSTPLVQAYDPSGIMLQQSEKDLEALAKFSDTLGGILKKKKEEIKNETIAKGFTKFITGEIVYNADTNEFRQQEALVEKEAANATAIANAAETLPDQKGMSAQIRRTSPALRGLEALGASRAMAQSAGLSYTNYVNQAINEGRSLKDPDTGATIQLTKRMNFTEWDRARKILIGLWGQDTGYNRINPSVMMEYGSSNLAVAMARHNETFGQTLDDNAKEESRLGNLVNAQSNLLTITDSDSAISGLAIIERNDPSPTKERNENFRNALKGTIDKLLVDNQGDKALQILENTRNQIHPSKAGTYGEYFSDLYTELSAKVQQAGADKGKQIYADRLAQLTFEARVFDQKKPAERQVGMDDIAKRARAAGIDEEDVTKLVTGGSTPFEVALLDGLRSGRLIGGKNGITKTRIDQLLASRVIDESVATSAKAIPGVPEGTRTVEGDYKESVPLAEVLVTQWQTAGWGPSGATPAGQQVAAKAVRTAALLQAQAEYAQVVQRRIDANQPVNVSADSEAIAKLAKNYLSDINGPMYWSLGNKTAPNIDKLSDQQPDLNATFQTNLPKDTLNAIINNVTSGIVIPATSVTVPQAMYDAAQLAVNTGGPVPTSIVKIAKAAGAPNVNAFLAQQGVDNNYSPWKPNQAQEQYLMGVRQSNPALAKRLGMDLTPTDRKSVLSQLKALQTRQEMSQQLPLTSGNAFSTLQQAIVYEESRGDYGQYNFGVSRTGPGNPAITNLKVKDVIRGDFAIDGQIVKHFGAYQFNPKTLAAVIKAAGISPDQPFNQATQDKAFQALVVGGALSWRNKLNDYMAGKVPDTTQNLAAAMADLSTEWQGAQKIPDVKLGKMLRDLRLEQTSVVDPKLSTLPGPARTVETGKMLLARGIKMWQHPNFDLDKGYVASGGRVGGHSARSFHYSNQALDLPGSHNTLTQLDATFDYLLKNAEALGISEIYWDRKGYYRDGQMIGGPRSKAIPDHDDHLHVSFN